MPKNKSKGFQAPLREKTVNNIKKKSRRKSESPPLMDNVISSSGNVMEEQPFIGESPKMLLTQSEPGPSDEAKFHNVRGKFMEVSGNKKHIAKNKKGKQLLKKGTPQSLPRSNPFSNTVSSDSDDDLGKKLQSILEGIGTTSKSNTENSNDVGQEIIENSELDGEKTDTKKEKSKGKENKKPDKKSKKKKPSPNKKKVVTKDKIVEKILKKKKIKKGIKFAEPATQNEDSDSAIDCDESVIDESIDENLEENQNLDAVIPLENQKLDIVKPVEVPIAISSNIHDQEGTSYETLVRTKTPDKNVEKDAAGRSETTTIIPETPMENVDTDATNLENKEQTVEIDKNKREEKTKSDRVRKAEFWKDSRLSKKQPKNFAKEKDIARRKKKGDASLPKPAPKENKSRQSVQAMLQMSQELLLESSQYPQWASSQPSRSLSHVERLLWLQRRRGSGLWVRCDRKKSGGTSLCNKWRFLEDVADPTELPDKWYCDMHPDPDMASCSAKETPLTEAQQEDLVHNTYTAGSIVWGRADGYPWWPAMVDDCVDSEQYYWLDSYSNIPTHYNVVFFDSGDVTRCWLRPDQLHTLRSAIPPNGRMCRNRLYEKRIQFGLNQAMKARRLSIKERLKKYSFLTLYKGEIITPPIDHNNSDDHENCTPDDVFSRNISIIPASGRLSSVGSKRRPPSVASTCSSMNVSGRKSKLEEIGESLQEIIQSIDVDVDANNPIPEDLLDSEQAPQPKKARKEIPKTVTKNPAEKKDGPMRTVEDSTDEADVSNVATAGIVPDSEMISSSQQAKRNSEPSELKDLSDLIAVQKSLQPLTIPARTQKREVSQRSLPNGSFDWILKRKSYGQQEPSKKTVIETDSLNNDSRNLISSPDFDSEDLLFELT